RDWCVVTYFLMNKLEKLPMVSKETLEQPNMWCFIENNSYKTIEVNLIDYFTGKQDNPYVKNLNYNCVYNDQPQLTFTKLKIATTNTRETFKRIEVIDEKLNTITPIYPIITEHSFHDWICEIPINLTINKEIKLITS